MDASMVDFILYHCESTSQCTLGSLMPMEPTPGRMREKLGHRLLPGEKWHMKLMAFCTKNTRDGIKHIFFTNSTLHLKVNYTTYGI
jgi:hypothetical protein